MIKRTTPTPALDQAEPGIEPSANGVTSGNGIDTAMAVSGRTMEESVANIGENDLLQYRLTQQATLSDFGLEALRLRSLERLQQVATRLCADGMRAKLCKLLCYSPKEDDFLVTAGVGWSKGVVGHTRIGSDLDSPAGYALRTGKPVISNHLANECRFRTPKLLADHGVKRAINVLVLAHDRPWGVLEVDSSDEGKFDVADIPFLQGFGNLLGVAIERQHAEDALNQALDHQRLLARESSHRIKNSLALVSSLLHLQAKDTEYMEVQRALKEAEARIQSIGAAHDLLWRTELGGEISVANLLENLCCRLQTLAPRVEISCHTEELSLHAERAIAVGLLVTELVTNAIKHAYADGSGSISVSCVRDAQNFEIRVADRGRGLPSTFSIKRPRDASLGVKMIAALAKQLGGSMECENSGGAAFILTAPVQISD